MKNHYKKVIGGAFGGMALFGGGVVIADSQINPYVDKGATLEIAKVSSIPEGGEVRNVVSKNEPKIRLEKWGGEVAMGVKYIGISSNIHGNRPLFSKKVEWKEGKQTMEAVPIDATTTMEDGGMEINIILASEPASNVFTFQLDNWQNLDFFYQPELSAQDIAEGAVRPDNVIGSYAVYYKNHANHKVGDTNYATGKAYHIFRPLVTDNLGQTTWADLAYDNGVLTVTVPQSFLDSASYPVKVDPTFGYTTIGGTQGSFTAGTTNLASLVGQYTAAAGDTVTQISVYGNVLEGASSEQMDFAIYTISGGVPVTRTGTATTITPNSQTPQWWNSSTLSISLSASTAYDVAFGNYTFSNHFQMNRDVTSGNQNDQQGTGALPSSWTHGVNSASQYSVYATYTASAVTTYHADVKLGNANVNFGNSNVIIK